MNDPEGPNLLIVMVGAAVIFALSLPVYLLKVSQVGKLASAMLIQFVLVAAFYYFG